MKSLRNRTGNVFGSFLSCSARQEFYIASRTLRTRHLAEAASGVGVADLRRHSSGVTRARQAVGETVVTGDTLRAPPPTYPGFTAVEHADKPQHTLHTSFYSNTKVH